MENTSLSDSEGTPQNIFMNTSTIIMACLAIYLNIVFTRATTNTPLLHRNCRYTVRFTAYLNCLMCLIAVIAGMMNFNGDDDSIQLTQLLFLWTNTMTIIYPFFTLTERLIFSESAKYRENEKHGLVTVVKMILFLLCLATCFTLGCVAHYMGSIDPTQYVVYQIMNISIGLPSVFLLLVLFFLIKDKNMKFSLKGGVLVEKRRTEIKEEQLQMNLSIAPYFVVFCLFLLLDFVIYISANKLYNSTGLFAWNYRLLLHSVRVICSPLSFVLFNELLREDFRSNFLVWKEVKQRTSKMKVVHFTSRESQEVILNNFKMMGLIGDTDDGKPKDKKEKRKKSTSSEKSSTSTKAERISTASKNSV